MAGEPTVLGEKISPPILPSKLFSTIRTRFEERIQADTRISNPHSSDRDSNAVIYEKIRTFFKSSS